MNESFAHRHKHLGNGFRVWPHWFTASRFWQTRKAEHRAVFHQLLLQTVTLNTTFRTYDLPVRRGQYVTTMEQLTADSGFGEGSLHQARNALKPAIDASIITRSRVTARVASHTQILTIIEWTDFDAYDRPDEWKPRRKTGFAVENHASTGFTCWPRWFTDTSFWKALSPRSRAVVIAIYDRLPGVSVTLPSTGETLRAGQWVMNADQIADEAGCGKDVNAVIAAIDQLRRAGVADFDPRADGNIMIRWHDFELYNLAAQSVQSLVHSPVHSLIQSPVQSSVQCKDRDYPSSDYRSSDLRKSPEVGPKVRLAPADAVRDFTLSHGAGALAEPPAAKREPHSRKSSKHRGGKLITVSGDGLELEGWNPRAVWEVVIEGVAARAQWWPSGVDGPGSIEDGLVATAPTPSVPRLAAYWLANVAYNRIADAKRVELVTDEQWGRAIGVVKQLLSDVTPDDLAARIDVAFGEEFAELNVDGRDPCDVAFLTHPGDEVICRLDDPDRWAAAGDIASEIEAVADEAGEVTTGPGHCSQVDVFHRLTEMKESSDEVLRVLRGARKFAPRLDAMWHNREKPFTMLSNAQLLLPRPWKGFRDDLKRASAMSDDYAEVLVGKAELRTAGWANEEEA